MASKCKYQTPPAFFFILMIHMYLCVTVSESNSRSSLNWIVLELQKQATAPANIFADGIEMSFYRSLFKLRCNLVIQQMQMNNNVFFFLFVYFFLYNMIQLILQRKLLPIIE